MSLNWKVEDEMKKIGKISVILLAGLALAGCSQKPKQKTSSKGSATIKVTKNKKRPTKMGHLSDQDLSPQKTVAVVVAYAGDRYSGSWNKALLDGKQNGIEVDLKNQSNYSYMNEGSGVAYMVSADAGYTLKQVNGENIYYLFSNGKKLGSVTMKQMVDYLNKRDSDSLVNSLAQNAKVNDERSDSGDDSSDSAGKKSNLPGDDGLFNVPTEFQGTWYTYNDDKMSIIKISQNKINVDNYIQELHKVKAGFLDKYTYGDMSASYHKATKNWGMAGMGSQRVHGINYMNVRGWMQEAGDGDFYGLHTENGQSVLVLAQGAGPWVSGVAWKTPQLAQQYKHKKFKDLYYQDD